MLTASIARRRSGWSDSLGIVGVASGNRETAAGAPRFAQDAERLEGTRGRPRTIVTVVLGGSDASHGLGRLILRPYSPSRSGPFPAVRQG